MSLEDINKLSKGMKTVDHLGTSICEGDKMCYIWVSDYSNVKIIRTEMVMIFERNINQIQSYYVFEYLLKGSNIPHFRK